MTDLQFACPHCQGIVKVTSSMAGSAVKCPLCIQVFQVPASPNVEASTENRSSSAADDLMKFACPQCTEPFQVTRSSLGKAVACPSCNSPVQLPSTGVHAQGQPQESQPAPRQPSAQQSPIEAIPKIVTTPGPTAAPDAELRSSDQSIEAESAPRTEQPTPTSKPTTVDDLLPPKFTRRLPQAAMNAAALSGVILHEPVRKVQTGDQTRKLVVVSDEVKARRRIIRNAIMFGFGSLLLIVAARLLIR